MHATLVALFRHLSTMRSHISIQTTVTYSWLHDWNKFTYIRFGLQHRKCAKLCQSKLPEAVSGDLDVPWEPEVSPHHRHSLFSIPTVKKKKKSNNLQPQCFGKILALWEIWSKNCMTLSGSDLMWFLQTSQSTVQHGQLLPLWFNYCFPRTEMNF